MKKWLCVWWWLVGVPLLVLAQTSSRSSNTPAYPLAPAMIRDIGKDLYESLKSTYRHQISPSPIWIREDARFSARPFQFESEASPTRIVYLSDAFLQLAHSVAHAKAIDKIEPGFLARYTAEFSRMERETNSLQGSLPVMADARYWREDVMNEQAGYFNQIVAVVAAINLAHHYLGHYEKYGASLRDSAIDPTTIGGLCAENEWRMALQRGADNALDCGFAFEGIKVFYDFIANLDRRPPWTLYFLPVKASLPKIKKDFDLIEARFFGQK